MPDFSIDQLICSWVTQFANQSWLFDYWVEAISCNHLLKGVLVVLPLWYFWFLKKYNQERNRVVICITVMACFINVFLCKVLEHHLPHSPRPVFNQDLKVSFPKDINIDHFQEWSSFPSDHSVLFVTLIVGIFYLSSFLGMIFSIYVIVMVFLPRIYLGLHYPSDILGGASIAGVLTILYQNIKFFRLIVLNKILPLVERKPETFYVLFFVALFLVSTLFDSLRLLIDNLQQTLIAFLKKIA